MEQKTPVVDSLTPIGYRVLLNIYKKPNTTTAGFELPETENAGMPVMAQITVVGRKTWLQKLQQFLGLKPKYKVGDWVYFRKYAIDELRYSTELGDLVLYILEESEIIGLAKII